ncbi:MAG: amino acid adenylation domain-containing protein [Actinomycetota bacterium]|nr:amino acid adenylation domain-containing protein [Actinomycetota bacterium]
MLRQRTARSSIRDLRPRAPHERVPLSYAQRRLWVLDQLDPGNAAYNETNSLRLGALDPEVLARALNEIVRRHEVLRMRVVVIDGEPFQDFVPALQIPVPLIDLRHHPEPEREAEALRRAAETSRVPMTLGEAPLLRASVFRLDPGDHLFVLTLHHMLCDGWSMGVLMVELLMLYWSFLAGKPSPLPELQIQYGDYAVWQRRALVGDERSRQLAYWRQQLDGLPTMALPTDRPRPAEFSFKGNRHPIEITGAELESLTALARQQNVTVFVLLLTAFSVLLRRYLDEDDIVIGTPTLGRTRTELEPLIGLFVNTVVVRLTVGGRERFLDVLGRVRDASVAAAANAAVPFEAVVQELHPPRDKSRNPLFQVMFQLFQSPSVPGLDASALLPFAPVSSGIAKVDLSLELMWTEDRVHGYFEYSTDLFDAARISRMAGHLRRLLGGIVADPDQEVAHLPLLTPAEERQLDEWNDTAQPFPSESTVPAVFREQVERDPDAVAVRFGGETLTYRELRDRADELAADLLSHRIGPGDRVALYLDRCLDVPAALLAILGVGGIYVPLDPDNPPDRLLFMLRDSSVKAVLTNGARAGELGEFSGPVLPLDAPARAPSVGPQSRSEQREQSPTDVAYIMYTSGTTGVPKGVTITHRNILRLVKNVRYLRYDSRQTVLQFAPLSFDASTFEIWASLLNGGVLAVHPPGVPSLDELGAFIRTEQVSLLFLTTSLFRQMVERRPDDLRGVAQVVTGGEAMFPPLAKAAWEALPRSRVVNAYGPTECTAFACTYDLRTPQAFADEVPIGRPIDNTTTYVVDRFGNRVPVGVVGELCIGGEGVAPGYWDRPELTMERFVPDPFRPGGRMYRSGDLTAFREDGNLLFVGRRDRQVKVSGYRIELGEVEAAVLSHPDVRAAAVLVSGRVDKHLSVACEVVPGRTLSLAALREHMQRRVPHYMLPSDLRAVERLPLTPNGKVDFEALAGAERAPLVSAAEYVGPRDSTERALCALWTELLEVDRVGVTDNFFDLGGHSLVATRLLSRIRATYDVPLTMRQFFDAPTVESLGRIIAQPASATARA